MPNQQGSMDTQDMRRLKEWRVMQNEIRMYEEFDTHSLEAVGADYQRPLTTLTHSDCDEWAADTIGYPRPPIDRRKRFPFRRLNW